MLAGSDQDRPAATKGAMRETGRTSVDRGAYAPQVDYVPLIKSVVHADTTAPVRMAAAKSYTAETGFTLERLDGVARFSRILIQNKLDTQVDL